MFIVEGVYRGWGRGRVSHGGGGGGRGGWGGWKRVSVEQVS